MACNENWLNLSVHLIDIEINNLEQSLTPK